MNSEHTLTRRAFLAGTAAAATTVVAGPRRGLARTTTTGHEAAPPPLAPRIGICTSLGNAGILRAAGADYVEPSVRGLLVPDQPDEAFAPNLALAGSSAVPPRAANSFLPGSLQCTGPAADHGPVLDWAETALARARAVGLRTIVFGSSGARTIPGDFDRATAELQFVALLGKMAPLAERHDVTIAVEPLNRKETNFINSVGEGARLVRAVQHSRIRLVADIYHMMCEDEPAKAIVEAGDLIAHVHVAEREGRTPPGVHGEDLRPYLRALRSIEYRGPISIECRWTDLAAQARPAIGALRAQLADVS